MANHQRSSGLTNQQHSSSTITTTMDTNNHFVEYLIARGKTSLTRRLFPSATTLAILDICTSDQPPDQLQQTDNHGQSADTCQSAEQSAESGQSTGIDQSVQQVVLSEQLPALNSQDTGEPMEMSAEEEPEEIEPEPSTSSTIPLLANAKSGWYPVLKIKRRGPCNHLTRGRVMGNLVEHADLVYFDEDLDCPDLEPEELGPINAPTDKEKYYWADTAPKEMDKERRKKRGANPNTSCRFCHGLYSSKEVADIHERDVCTAAGAPGHVCDSDCIDNCPGNPPYQKAKGKPLGRKKSKK
ncbi:uncharacterized protein LOC128386281 [Panonychus citri]|uniref:uncharacterized protein LOC128386281 n=1 Tax=Panonychus citri TaxID=50023 RepID=UPI0023070C80|nr:uncharacterized protein LOC128386281 [Panonychus citri]